jgi:hypothetical protein
MRLLTLTEKGKREEKERAQATPTTTGCTGYRLHRLLSFSIKNVFHLFSLYLLVFCLSLILILEKKTVFSCIPSSLLRFLDNAFLSFIFCTTPLRPICGNKQQLLLSTNIITCGRYSIAINSNYLSCLCKTCTYANEKTRSIKIIIMALSSVCIRCIYLYKTILKISRSITRHHVRENKVTIDLSNVRYQI